MSTIIFDPLRWQKTSSRLTIVLNDQRPRVYYQVTASTDLSDMCKGRPVEEIPRIVSILSPTHHLVSAMALDQLFAVEPPQLAVNMREALLYAQYFSHHLRKFFFLLAADENPFADYQTVQRHSGRLPARHRLLDDIMHHLGLSQEAAAILGGRADHPLSAVVGGVSRYLKQGMYERLGEIAGACEQFAQRLAENLHNTFFGDQKAAEGLLQVLLPSLPSLTRENGLNEVILRDEAGKEVDRFAPDQTFAKIGIRSEPWSYESFAFIRSRGWEGVHRERLGGLYQVGPLARLNGNTPMDTPLAEQERQRLMESLGPLPVHNVLAGYWAHLVELIQAAEKMTQLFVQEKLVGPSIRTIPDTPGRSGYALLEAPEGLIYHHYEVNRHGLLEEIRILDAATENNGLRCLVAENAVEAALGQKESRDQMKTRVEISLMPF